MERPEQLHPHRQTARAAKEFPLQQPGLDKDGFPAFKEMAHAYGLDDTSYSVQSAFLDYDGVGDIYMHLATTKPTTRITYTFGNRKHRSKNGF